jgi:hypothetical protein
MSEKYGFVYIWYDRKHKRFYVGSHWGTVDDGYICSSRWMHKAKRNRPQDFKRRVIEIVGLDRKELYVREQYWLSMIKDEEIRHKYYNLNKFVKDPWYQHPDKVLSIGQKISKSKTGKSNGPHSEVTKLKMSQAKKGAKFSPEHKEKLRQAKLGKKQSEEQKLKRSESLKEAWATGNRARKKPSMSIEEQGKLSSNRLKNLWSDPVWAANQREKLRIGAQQRYLNKSKQTKEAA